ncbi:MAG: FkbM family methyltransferase [Syntrophus sp. (in: bacteria)]
MEHFFKLLKLVERKAAFFRGKGYGSATIRQEVKLVYKLLVKSPTLAIDIGGNVGDYAAELRRRNKGLEIHIFEPSSTNISKLTARFANDRLIKTCPYAVSDSHGEATLFSDAPGSGAGSLTLRRLDHFNVTFRHCEVINTIRFETYWKDVLEGRTIDIVKLDIEGHELSALTGFGEAINSVRIIQFEFGGCNIDTRTFFQDFWYFFQDHHYEVFRITPLGAEKIHCYRETDEFFSTTNYIARNQKTL